MRPSVSVKPSSRASPAEVNGLPDRAASPGSPAMATTARPRKRGDSAFDEVEAALAGQLDVDLVAVAHGRGVEHLGAHQARPQRHDLHAGAGELDGHVGGHLVEAALPTP